MFVSLSVLWLALCFHEVLFIIIFLLIKEKKETFHTKGKEVSLGKLPEKFAPKLGMENMENSEIQKEGAESMQWEAEQKLLEEPKFKFQMGPSEHKESGKDDKGKECKLNGPMAMSFTNDLGWVTEILGPKSGHWKRMAKTAHAKNKKGKEKLSPLNTKRESPIPLKDLFASTLEQKRRKKTEQLSTEKQGKNNTDGSEAVSAEQSRRAQ